ncbi:hypothetical protein OUS11_002447 [Enterococcus hirae]|nr:hypothetical protein [Enterococcus hirae]
MNPKIKNLIEELMHECNESDVAITLGAIDPSADEATVVFGGTFALQTKHCEFMKTYKQSKCTTKV